MQKTFCQAPRFGYHQKTTQLSNPVPQQDAAPGSLVTIRNNTTLKTGSWRSSMLSRFATIRNNTTSQTTSQGTGHGMFGYHQKLNTTQTRTLGAYSLNTVIYHQKQHNSSNDDELLKPPQRSFGYHQKQHKSSKRKCGKHMWDQIVWLPSETTQLSNIFTCFATTDCLVTIRNNTTLKPSGTFWENGLRLVTIRNNTTLKQSNVSLVHQVWLPSETTQLSNTSRGSLTACAVWLPSETTQLSNGLNSYCIGLKSLVTIRNNTTLKL